MSITYGFYNSVDGDRKYNASHFSKLFSGVINDGIFMTIGDRFTVTANSGNTVLVGAGKGWFNETWIESDNALLVDCGASEVLYDRIDAVVVEIDTVNRINDIKVIKGIPADIPATPSMIADEGVYRYPLCYIYREAGSVEIKQSNITDKIGSDETPFVTGILETVSLDERLGQWRAQLDEFVLSEQKRISNELDEFEDSEEDEFKTWSNGIKTLIGNVGLEVEAWLNRTKTKLSEDVETNLQMQIDESEVKRILLVGFTDGTKTITEDGSVTTSIDSLGRRLVKTFTDDFSVCTTELFGEQGALVGRLVKTFSSDGLSSTSEVTIM